MFRKVWLIPSLLALSTLFGLLAALLGTGIWHLLSWITLAVPLVVMGWKIRQHLFVVFLLLAAASANGQVKPDTARRDTAHLSPVLVTSEHINKYANPGSEYAAKIPLKNLENPQVYNVVPKELMKDQMVNDFRSALENVPGGTPMQNPDRSIFIMLRGFEAYGNIRNGISIGASGFNNVDPVNLERIEVLKGPSATLFGSAISSYGGLVNRVTKKPYETFGGEVSYSGGQYNLTRLTADINTPLNQDKTALLRVNAAYHQEGSFYDVSGGEKKWIVAPSFSYKVNDRLTLRLDAEVAYNNSIALIEGGIGLTNLSAKRYDQIKVPYNSALTGPNVKNQVGNTSVFASAEYKLAHNWTSTTVYSQSTQNMDAYNMVFVTFQSDSTLSRAVYGTRQGQYKGLELQENIVGVVHTGFIKHRLLLGLDFFSNSIYAPYSYIPYDADLDYRKAGTGNMIQQRIDDSVAKYGITVSNSNQHVFAAYASDVINLTDRLIAQASVRVDRYVAPGDGGYQQTAWSPKFGLIYQPVKDRVSLFANYLNGFQNQSGSNFALVPFKPQHANQWEAGVKTDLISNRLSLTLTYYDILVSNLTRADTAHPGFSVQDATQRSKGFEAELVANLLPGLNIVGGYGYNDNAYDKTDQGMVGKRPVESPRNTINWWANYKVQNGDLKGFMLGFGGNYVSEMFGYFDAVNAVPLPAYTVLRATLAYEQPKWTAGLRWNNMGGKHYWNTNGQAQTPSQVTGTITYRF